MHHFCVPKHNANIQYSANIHTTITIVKYKITLSRKHINSILAKINLRDKSNNVAAIRNHVTTENWQFYES